MLVNFSDTLIAKSMKVHKVPNSLGYFKFTIITSDNKICVGVWKTLNDAYLYAFKHCLFKTTFDGSKFFIVEGD